LQTQARRQPLRTARFVAAEIWRRSRQLGANGLDRPVPELTGDACRLHPFLPATPAESFASGLDDEGRSQLLAAATRILRGEFEIFGEWTPFPAAPDWHLDWVSGYRWPLGPLGRNRIVNAAPGADIKRPWELSRFHHLLPLGQAFVLTRDPQYAEQCVANVSHWMEQNPAPRGIHWAVPMEAAIRAINWMTALALFSSAEFPAAFRAKALDSLFQHGRHIFALREWNPVARGNHYLACVAGLAHLGVLFHDSREGARWLEFSRRALRQEMLAQVGDDGVAHEGSTGYHAFATELFASAALVLARIDARRNGASSLGSPAALCSAITQSCGLAFIQRLEKMFRFLAILRAGRFKTPIIGDSDDGRLLRFCTGNDAAAHLVSLGQALFGIEDASLAPHLCGEPLWRLGIPPAQPARIENPARASADFPASGFYVLGGDRLRSVVRCGPLGVGGWASHAHCDQLSFDLCSEGHPVLVDPGTYLYSGDPAARNEFRGSCAHNSPVVDAAEQNRFWPGLLFRILEDTRSRAELWDCDERRVIFGAAHSGYTRLKPPVEVRRTLLLRRSPEMLLVCDGLHGEGSVPVDWNFQLAPEIQPRPIPMQSRGRPVGNGHPFSWTGRLAPSLADLHLRAAWDFGGLQILLWAHPGPAALTSEIVAGSVSPAYGKRLSAPRLRLHTRAPLPLRVAFLFGYFDSSTLREWGCE